MNINSRRAIWIVLDGVGVGELPDAADYGDRGAATLQHVAAACGGLALPNLKRLGLGHLAAIPGVPPDPATRGAFGRMRERAAGKDSISGHWELAGVTLDKAFATYPNGFPDELVAEFTALSGVSPLGNVASSGTAVLEQFGPEHLLSARPILYTSVDSVFQLAAHLDIMSEAHLYRLCLIARQLCDRYRIGRVIARPFKGDPARGFSRTSGRKDFPVPPPAETLLDRLSSAGVAVCSVGKVADLFAGRGISRILTTTNNNEGMALILDAWETLPAPGLIAANLIDFDMIYGHRRDARGFGQALETFDAWLPRVQSRMREEDLLLICADHGCDPLTPGTDHTREYVPLLAWRPGLSRAVPLNERSSFADLGATLAEFFGVGLPEGESFYRELVCGGKEPSGETRSAA